MTGTIARTATNVRAGARGPVSGMLHAVFLLLFMLVAAPLASYIPLAALAAVLAVVAWNMAEKHEFATLLRASRGDAVVLLVTFLLVVFRDLTEGILVGFGIGALLFIHRMAQAIEVDRPSSAVVDVADDGNGDEARQPTTPALATDRTSSSTGSRARSSSARRPRSAAALDRIGEHPKAYVIDVSAVPVLELDRGGDHRGLREKSSAAGSGGVHRRCAPRHPANAPRTRCAPAVGSISVRPRRSHRGGTPGWRLKTASPWSGAVRRRQDYDDAPTSVLRRYRFVPGRQFVAAERAGEGPNLPAPMTFLR